MQTTVLNSNNPINAKRERKEGKPIRFGMWERWRGFGKWKLSGVGEAFVTYRYACCWVWEAWSDSSARRKAFSCSIGLHRMNTVWKEERNYKLKELRLQAGERRGLCTGWWGISGGGWAFTRAGGKGMLVSPLPTGDVRDTGQVGKASASASAPGLPGGRAL